MRLKIYLLLFIAFVISVYFTNPIYGQSTIPEVQYVEATFKQDSNFNGELDLEDKAIPYLNVLFAYYDESIEDYQYVYKETDIEGNIESFAIPKSVEEINISCSKHEHRHCDVWSIPVNNTIKYHRYIFIISYDYSFLPFTDFFVPIVIY